MKKEAPQRKPLDPIASKMLLGMLGERIIATHLRKLGHTVEESLDVFDSEKDLLVDGLKTEVKTQVPVLMEDAFGVSPRQLPKLMTCHRVYFLSVPPSKFPDDLAGCVYELDPRDDFRAHRRTLQDKREVVCFPRRQSAMKLLFRIEDIQVLEQLKYLTTSYL